MRFFQKAVAGPVKPSKNTLVPSAPWIHWQRMREAIPTLAMLHCTKIRAEKDLSSKSTLLFLSSLKVFMCTFACKMTAVVNAPLKHFQAQVDTKHVYWDLIQSQWLIEDYLSLSFLLESNFRALNIIFKLATVWRVHIIFPFAVSNAADWLLKDVRTLSGKALFNALPRLRTSLCIDGFFLPPGNRIGTVGTGKKVESFQSLPFKHSILQSFFSFHFFALPKHLDPCA